MDFYRSADMVLYEVSMHKENVWEIMNAFSEIKWLHIIDLNKDIAPHNLTFALKIKRIVESLRRITNIIEKEATKLGIEMPIPGNIEALTNVMDRQTRLKKKSPQMTFDIIEEDTIKYTKFIEEQQSREQTMHNNLIHLYEQREIYKYVAKLMSVKQEESRIDANSVYHSDDSEHDSEQDSEQIESLLPMGLRISWIAGTIHIAEKQRMQNLLFRGTRGTALISFHDIKKVFIDYNQNKYHKTAFVVMFEEGEYYREKINRIVDSFLWNKIEIRGTDFSREIRLINK